ncbi:MAG: peptidase domain-containing ABC transporter [Muribaculum sp.]|nr:peptidase domain-containing ABC transporter [Muribaculum sp.]
MNFPFVRQHDSMQCGVACLCMISRYFGRFVPFARMDRLCSPTTEGVSLKGIADAAEEIGLTYTALRINIEQLKQIPLPSILHWNQNHFVVLYKIDRNGTRFHIADPAKGKRHISLEEFKSHWIPGNNDDPEALGIAMVLEPGDNFRKGTESAIETKGAIKFFKTYLKGYHSYFIQIALGLILGCIFQLIIPFLTESIVDKGIKNSDIGFIWLILLGELCIVAGSTITDFIRRWLLLHISMRINICMISDFFIKLLRLPMSFFDTKLLGDLLQRMSDHSRVQSFLTNQTLNVLFSLISFVVFGSVLCYYNPLIFGVFILGSALYVLWISFFLQRRKALDYDLFEQQAVNSNKTYQLIEAMQEIKLHNCENHRRWEWEDTQAELFLLQMKSLKLQQTQEGGSVFINEIKNILVTVLAATAVINQDLTLGGMLAIQYIIGQLNSPVDQLMGFISAIQDVKISLDRINEIRTEKEEENDTVVRLSETTPTIKFDHVSFRYDRHSMRKAIDDISLTIPAGKMTAIVGASGSGKTTLLKLLLGFYPIEEGKIIINGVPIEDVSLMDWRKRCGCVMQEGVIFSDSISRNISAGDDRPDAERIKKAASEAMIQDYIESLPLGYHTKIGKDGVGLSKGQKQRILIARALYRNPQCIILDEATNALDTVNERSIMSSLENLRDGKTWIVVAHRLSTVKDADNIIVLADGKIAEQGTHRELVALRGKYYRLIQNQLELGE